MVWYLNGLLWQDQPATQAMDTLHLLIDFEATTGVTISTAPLHQRLRQLHTLLHLLKQATKTSVIPTTATHKLKLNGNGYCYQLQHGFIPRTSYTWHYRAHLSTTHTKTGRTWTRPQYHNMHRNEWMHGTQRFHELQTYTQDIHHTSMTQLNSPKTDALMRYQTKQPHKTQHVAQKLLTGLNARTSTLDWSTSSTWEFKT